MMEINIFQVNSDRDINGVAFMNLDQIADYQLPSVPDAEIYDNVYSGKVDCSSLDGIYNLFNADHPDDYHGHSLSVSDIIEVVSSDKIEKGFYYCDSIGFKKIPFESDRAKNRSDNDGLINVVLVEPGKLSRITKIDKSLASMQNIVGGMIEEYCPFDDDVAIICDDEGKMNGQKLNRAVYGENNQIIDIIAGPFIICAVPPDSEDFCGLSDEQAKKYAMRFKYPEQFFKVNDEIRAMRYKSAKNADHEL